MKHLYIFLLALFIFTTGFAQTFTVNGVVLEQSTRAPLPGATVIQKGTQNGVTTDFNGSFSIENISSGDVLVFSYLGFITQERIATSSGSLTINLAEDIASLDEIVVIGYGTQKKKEITGAVAIVSQETIEELKPTRVEQALQGQVAGVQITSQSGSPG
ncbi:MAG: carboxypeptidase-like regulatory domain-containing protein, partial [Bacteroidia bacterium]|nr:carboxypeptidase-like regulatory domain-containing protein [Bacteroidia bacterium]